MEGIEVKYTGKISDEAFNKLRAKHGDIFTMEVPVNDNFSECAVGYFKKPDRQLMSAILSVVDKVAQKEMLLKECFVEGDKRILEDDELFFSAMTVSGQLMSYRVAVLKKN